MHASMHECLNTIKSANLLLWGSFTWKLLKLLFDFIDVLLVGLETSMNVELKIILHRLKAMDCKSHQGELKTFCYVKVYMACFALLSEGIAECGPCSEEVHSECYRMLYRPLKVTLEEKCSCLELPFNSKKSEVRLLMKRLSWPTLNFYANQESMGAFENKFT